MTSTRGTEDWCKFTVKRCRLFAAALSSFNRAFRFLNLLINSDAVLVDDIKSALHHSAIISYAQPFYESNGLGKLSISDLGTHPDFDLDVHNQLKKIRDKLIAHNDQDEFSTSRLVTDHLERELQEGEAEPLIIPVRYSVSNKSLHMLTDMALCQRYIDHVNACFEKAREFGHFYLSDLAQENCNKSSEIEGQQIIAQESISVEPKLISDDKVSFLMPENIGKDFREIPDPILDIGEGAYQYEPSELFNHFKEWEMTVKNSSS